MTFVTTRCTKFYEALDLSLLINWPKIQVKSILRDTILGHGEEEKRRYGSGCGSNLDFCDVLISDDPVERSGPPEAKFPVVVRIDYNLLPCQWHEASSTFRACMVGSSGGQGRGRTVDLRSFSLNRALGDPLET